MEITTEEITVSPKHENLFGQKSISDSLAESLKMIGVTFTPVEFEDIARITSRDTDNGRYPYNAGFTESGKRRQNIAVIINGVEIGYYCWKIGKDQASGQTTAETGMIHITPALRGRGLGTLIKLYAHMQEIEAGANEIRSVEADETGTIEKLNQELGFKKVEERTRYSLHPEWRLLLRSPSERSANLIALKQRFDAKIAMISQKDLLFSPDEIDRDNPTRLPIRQAAVNRLNQNGAWFNGDNEKILYGYNGSPVAIFLERGIQEDKRVVLRLQNRVVQNKQHFEDTLREAFQENCPKIFPYPNELYTTAWETQSPMFSKPDVLKQYVEKFSDAAQSFFASEEKEEIVNAI